MSRLFEKYFPVNVQVEDENERQDASDLRDRLASLVASSGWGVFRDRVDLMVTHAMDIRPGAENDMLYQIGKKDGLMEIRALLTQIEREIVLGGP